MKKIPRPKFYALQKDFNDGKIKPYDVLTAVFYEILTEKDTIKKKSFCISGENWKPIPVRTKEQCFKFVKDILMYHFWGNATWEYVAIDWPYRDTIKESRPVKIDVYEQLEPNLPLIVDLVWDYIEPKIKKLKEKENE